MLLYLSQRRKEAEAIFSRHPKAQELIKDHMTKIKSRMDVLTLSVEDLTLVEESCMSCSTAVLSR